MTIHIIDLTGVKPASPRSPAGGLKGPPVSGVEFLDVQSKLLKCDQKADQLLTWLAVGWVFAFGGWITVALMIWMTSR